jgi:hypothetical protein
VSFALVSAVNVVNDAATAEGCAAGFWRTPAAGLFRALADLVAHRCAAEPSGP